MARRAGVAPSEFWQLTPYLLRQIVEEHFKERREQAVWIKWGAYSGAALTRVKRFPTWATFSGEQPNAKKGIDEAAIVAMFEGIKKRQQARREGKA